MKLKLKYLRLNYYERKNARYPITKLQKEIMNHYENQFLKQIHVLVLGLDVLGNPFGVVRGLKQGVESFFYEPYKVNQTFYFVLKKKNVLGCNGRSSRIS